MNDDTSLTRSCVSYYSALPARQSWAFTPVLLSTILLLVPLILAALILAALILAPLTPLHAQTVAKGNPALTAACGLDVILVLDESASLQPYAEVVRSSVTDLLTALAGTDSRLALIEFNIDARTPLGGNYLALTNEANGPLSPTGALTLYLQNNYQPTGFTNWDAAFVKTAELNSQLGTAPLVIFFTDDTPTIYTNQFGAQVGGDVTRALDEAIDSANQVKAQGSHIFVVGLGDVTLENRVIDISGPSRFPDDNQPFAQSDYTITNYDQFPAALRQIAFSLCGPSVTVTKYANSASGPQLVANQSFSGQVTITSAGQPANGYGWTQPVSGTAVQVGTSQSTATAANGTAQWQWTPGALQSPQPWTSQFVLNENNQPGYYFSNASCSRKTFSATGGFTLTPFAFTTMPATFPVGPNDVITCNVYNDRIAVAVTKNASPSTVPETGGDVTFSFGIVNNGTGPATLVSLTDSHFGNLHNQGTCRADATQSLAVGEQYQCTVTKRIAGNRGQPHTNTVTATLRAATGTTISGSASATVSFLDSPPTATLFRTVTPNLLWEPGGFFTHTVTLTNISASEPLQFTALNDDRFGDVTAVGGSISATTCVLPQSIAPAGQPTDHYTCQFVASINGSPGTYADRLTATANDDDGNTITAINDRSVIIQNLLPTAAISVVVAPSSLPEPGGTIVFTATITNQSTIEPLSLTALTTNLNDIAAPQSLTSTCELTQTLAPGGSYQCAYQATVLRNSGAYTVAFDAVVADDDGSTLPLHTVKELELTNVPSSLLLTLQANQTTIAEPGGDITFTVTVKNSSPVDNVTIDTVRDSIYGDLTVRCPGLLTTLAPMASVKCVFVGTVAGAVGAIQTNEVTASGQDDDGDVVSDSDEESIEITDVPSLLDVTQVAEPANIPEPGGRVTVTTNIKNISLVDSVTIGKVETNEVDLIATQFRAVAASLVDISGTCQPQLPQILPPGQSLTCVFTKYVSGPIRRRHVSNVVVSGVDDENLPLQQTSREAIDIIDVPSSVRVTESSNPVSVPEAGATVTFTVKAENTSAVDTITLETLTSSRFGDLRSYCPTLLPAALAPGQSITCTFAEFVSGDVDTLLDQVISATATDDDGASIGDSTQGTIGVTDTPSSLRVVQLASPSGIAEPGAFVTFTVAIRNTSPVDTVTVSAVEDSRRGDLSTACTPQLPAALAPGAEMNCIFGEFVVGNAATVNERTVTVTATDDDGVTIRDFDLLRVDVLDVLPLAELTATAAPNRILETGQVVTMTVFLVNDGPEPLTVVELGSTLVGDLNGQGRCAVPQTLAADGGIYQCLYTHIVEGVASAPPANVVTALVVDDDDNVRALQNEADLFLIAVQPNLLLKKDDTLLVDLFDDPADEGKITPGDSLRYTIQVTNTGNGPAQQVLLTDGPDVNTALIVGSVTTSKGTILLGNTTDDTQVTVLVGDLAIGESVTVLFDVIILEGTGTALVRNQAFLSYGTFSEPGASNVEGSDDPNTPFIGDPTDTRVVLPPTGLGSEEEPPVLDRAIYLPIIQR